MNTFKVLILLLTTVTILTRPVCHFGHFVCQNSTTIIKDPSFKEIEMMNYTKYVFSFDSSNYYVDGKVQDYRDVDSIIQKFNSTKLLWDTFIPYRYDPKKIQTNDRHVYVVGCTDITDGFVIVTEQSNGHIVRREFKQNYCFNSIALEKDFYYLTGTKYDSTNKNLSYAFFSKHNLTGETILMREVGTNDPTSPRGCLNSGTDIKVDTTGAIYWTGTWKRSHSCMTYVSRINSESTWTQVFEPTGMSSSSQLVINEKEQFLAVTGYFTTNLKVSDTIRLTTCNTEPDGFLVSMNMKTGFIITAGSFCNISVISSLAIDECAPLCLDNAGDPGSHQSRDAVVGRVSRMVRPTVSGGALNARMSWT